MSVANEPFPWDFHSATLGHHYSWEVCLAAALGRIGGRSLENRKFDHNLGVIRPFQDLLAHHDVKEARKTELLSGRLTEIDQNMLFG